MMAADRVRGTSGGSIPSWEELEAICPGRVSLGVPMSRLTTFRLGGPADAVATPASVEEVVRVLRWSHGWRVPVTVVGAGSNLLVRDGGIRGLVLRVAPPLAQWGVGEQGTESVRVTAEAGLPLKRLLREGIRRGWGNMAHLVGIPGNLGGGLVMNAGTREGCLADAVERISWVGPDGVLVVRDRQDLAFEYRRLPLPGGCVVVEATLAFPREEPERVRGAVRAHMLRRREAQPIGEPSAGSVFRNPPGEFAGRLIERVGLKGFSRGGARISERHANFIVHAGGATAADVLGLIEVARERVARETGFCLELEIRVVGEEG